MGVEPDRSSDPVVVPDVVGMIFGLGRAVANESGVALANPDPDGPPIGALARPGIFVAPMRHRAASSFRRHRRRLRFVLGSCHPSIRRSRA